MDNVDADWIILDNVDADWIILDNVDADWIILDNVDADWIILDNVVQTSNERYCLQRRDFYMNIREVLMAANHSLERGRGSLAPPNRRLDSSKY